jgi:hypothetical protein
MAEEKGSPDNTPEQIVTLKASVIPKLAELGVRKLTVHYSGSGDEGFIDSIEFEPDGVVIPLELLALEVCAGLRAAEIFPQRHRNCNRRLRGWRRLTRLGSRSQSGSVIEGGCVDIIARRRLCGCRCRR